MLVQTKHPKTGRYVKIDTDKALILGHKKTKGAYKDIPIVTETYKRMTSDDFLQNEEIRIQHQLLDGVTEEAYLLLASQILNVPVDRIQIRKHTTFENAGRLIVTVYKSAEKNEYRKLRAGDFEYRGLPKDMEQFTEKLKILKEQYGG